MRCLLARIATATVFLVPALALPEDLLQIATPVTVVPGEQLRRSGARTVTEAIQDVGGVDVRPVETTFFDDVRLVSEFRGAGLHRLVGGTAITWGRTTATGTRFDFDLTVTPSPIVPDVGDVPVGDHRSYQDRRTFLGFYLNDEWTPTPRLTVSAGARYDSTSESLHVSRFSSRKGPARARTA